MLQWWHVGLAAIMGRFMSKRPEQSYVQIYFASGRREDFVLTGILAEKDQFISAIRHGDVIEMSRSDDCVECVMPDKIEHFVLIENWDGS